MKFWYMRDNHTFRRLPVDVEGAVSVLKEEIDGGNTYGMLCGHGEDGHHLRTNVHARSAAEWPAFEAAAREWLCSMSALRPA